MYENLFYQRLEKLRSEKGVSARDMSLSIGQARVILMRWKIETAFRPCRSFSISANI